MSEETKKLNSATSQPEFGPEMEQAVVQAATELRRESAIEDIVKFIQSELTHGNYNETFYILPDGSLDFSHSVKNGRASDQPPLVTMLSDLYDKGELTLARIEQGLNEVADSASNQNPKFNFSIASGSVENNRQSYELKISIAATAPVPPPAEQVPVTPVGSGGETEVKPETEKPKNKEVWCLVGEQFYKTATTILGVKTFTDFAEIVGRAVGQTGSLKERWRKAIAASKGDLGKYLKGKEEVVSEKKKLEEVLDELFKQYHEATDKKDDLAKNKFWNTVKELDSLTKEGGVEYLPEQDRKEYRVQLARIIWQYRKKQSELNKERNQKISQVGNLYLNNKVSGYIVARDALNGLFTASGTPMLRTVGYTVFAALERGSKANREFEKALLKGDKITEKDSKAGFVLKDVVINSTVETARSLIFQGKNKSSQHKVMDFVEAAGSVFRAFGLAALTVSQISHEGVTGNIGKMVNEFRSSFEQNGVLGGTIKEVGKNFVNNAERMWHLYTNPVETWQRVFGKEQATVVSGGSNISSEILKQGAVIEALSHKYGLSIPDLSQLPAGEVNSYAHYLQQLDETFTKANLSGHHFNVQTFLHDHPDMLAERKVPSVQEITDRFAKDIKIHEVAVGEGIENKGIQQILDDPKKFGFSGNINDNQAVRHYAATLAHQAALNTKIGGTAVADAQSDLRLKGSARGEEVRLVLDSNGQAHYEFSQGLNEADVYRHLDVAPQPTGQALHTESLDWWNKEFKQGTLLKMEMPGGSTTSDLAVYEFKGRDGSHGVLFVDDVKHEILPYSTVTDDYATVDFGREINETYHSLSQVAQEVSTAIGPNGQHWTVADKLLAAEWSSPKYGTSGQFDVKSFASAVNINRISDLVHHIGGEAPKYLKDWEFGLYIKDQSNLQDMMPAKAVKLWEIGQTVRANGFKSVDYGFINKMYSTNHDLNWNVQGDKFIADVKSPLANQPVELNIVDKSHFNESFYLENKQLANRIALNEQIVFNQLGHDFTSDQARQLMAMDVKDFKLSTLETHFGKGFLMFNNNSTIESWFHDIKPKLQGANAGTVGENLHRYFLSHKGVLESWKLKGVNLPLEEQNDINKPAVNIVETSSSQSNSTVSAAKEAIRQAEELEARLKAQDAIEKAEKILKEKK